MIPKARKIDTKDPRERKALCDYLKQLGCKTVVLVDDEVTVDVQSLADLVAHLQAHHTALAIAAASMRGQGIVGDQIGKLVLDPMHPEREEPKQPEPPADPPVSDPPVNKVEHAPVEDAGHVGFEDSENLS